MRREFTGRHMAIIIVSGFGVIIAVNLLMATLAVRGFGGVIVENSYVASQQFNGWLDAAERQKSLGWTARIKRIEHGHLAVETSAVPEDAVITAVARRPLGLPQTTKLDFFETTPDRHVSLEPLERGRWIVRLTIVSPDHPTWAIEEHLP
jgi:nitrogen fixation protein FixH